MFKNLTIRQISLSISCLLWLVQLAVFFAFLRVPLTEAPPIRLFLLSLTSLLLTVLIVTIIVEKYIFRKIKLVYKIISDSKDSLKNADISSSSSFESLDEQVKEWTVTTRNEISSLKSLENYRKEFLGNVSHELKTPLFSIQGYLHTLLEGGIYDEKINIKYLNRAAKNVERLQMIIDDLELINQLESNPDNLNFEFFGIKTVTEDVMNDLELIAKEKNIRLVFKSGADLSYKVYADKEKIRQVMINLLTNSIKYGKEGGRTKVSFYDMHDRILIEISDDGVGISEEDCKHIFDRFYRVDKSRSQEVKGSGLGLSIVKHILEVHNQSITIRSTEGRGSTFGFTLANKKQV